MLPRTIAALFSMLLMLASYVPVAVFSNSPQATGCCKDGHACCRKAHHHSGAQGGPQWQADPCGSPSCGNVPGTLSQSDAALPVPESEAYAVFFSWPLPRVQTQRAGTAQISLHLFQRPPPPLV